MIYSIIIGMHPDIVEGASVIGAKDFGRNSRRRPVCLVTSNGDTAHLYRWIHLRWSYQLSKLVDT